MYVDETIQASNNVDNVGCPARDLETLQCIDLAATDVRHRSSSSIKLVHAEQHSDHNTRPRTLFNRPNGNRVRIGARDNSWKAYAFIEDLRLRYGMRETWSITSAFSF